jgi:hypothetical protein
MGSHDLQSCEVKCQRNSLEWKAKVEGSQLRLFKAKEGSKKHEAAHA